MIARALERTASLWPDVEYAYRFVHAVAHWRGNPHEESAAMVQRRVNGVLGAMQRHRGKAGTLAGAFDLCRTFYAEAGFPDGWRDHHQGGTTGYASREVVASPETTQEVRAGQAFAWNPSLRGAKAEETFVLTEGGPEILTGS